MASPYLRSLKMSSMVHFYFTLKCHAILHHTLWQHYTPYHYNTHHHSTIHHHNQPHNYFIPTRNNNIHRIMHHHRGVTLYNY